MSTFHKQGIFILIVMVAIAAYGLIPNSTGATAQGETLTVWHSWQGADEELLNRWIENYSDTATVTLRFVYSDDLKSTYDEAVASGAGPDLVLGSADWVNDLKSNQHALALNDVLATNALASNLSANVWWSLMGVDGEYYGIPISLDGVSLYYNRALLADDEVPMTFDEMLELGVERTGNGNVGLIFDRGYYLTAGMYLALGGDLVDLATGANLWNTNGAAARFLELHREMFQASDEIYGGSAARFTAGEVAMIIEGSWRLADFKAALGDRLGVALLPNIDGDPWRPYVNIQGLYVNPDGKVDAALAFAAYVTTLDNLMLGYDIAGHIPPVEVGVLSDPYINNFVAQFGYGVPLPSATWMTAYMSNIDAAIVAATEGGQTPEDAAGAVQALLEEALISE